MKMGTLEGVLEALRSGEPEVTVDEATARMAVKPILRMLELSK